MIGANDLFIAAQARTLGLRPVTNKTAEFGRVKGLALENWTLPVRRLAFEGRGIARGRPTGHSHAAEADHADHFELAAPVALHDESLGPRPTAAVTAGGFVCELPPSRG